MRYAFRNKLVRLFKEAGWVCTRSRGKHDIFTHPDHPQTLTLPRAVNDINMVRRLLKLARIDAKL